MLLEVRSDPIVPQVERDVLRTRRAITWAIHRTARDLKMTLRADTRPVLGQRVANAWRERLYPAPPRVSADAAAIVYSRAPKIIDAWERGTPIRARNGRYLAIPLPEALRRGRIGGKRPSPDAYRRAGWTLRVVRTRRGELIVVGAARFTAAGRLRKPGVRQVEHGFVAWVPLFRLVPQVRFPRIFDLRRDARAAHMAAAARMEQRLAA